MDIFYGSLIVLINGVLTVFRISHKPNLIIIALFFIVLKTMIVVRMATIGSNQSERRKDNGAIVFRSRASLAWDTSSISSRDPF